MFYDTGDNISVQFGEKWDFDQHVPTEFETHIQKSVPFFKQCHDLVLDLSNYFITDDTSVIELGSATGHLAYQLACRYSPQKALVTGFDLSKQMIDYATKNYVHPHLKFIKSDITSTDFESANLFVSFYTLQFIAPHHRHALIRRLYHTLPLGGALILFEKIRANDARFQDIFNDLHTHFKLDNNYSTDQIYHKRQSLVGVLDPFTDEENLAMMKDAGFQKISSVFQSLCFKGYLCIK